MQAVNLNLLAAVSEMEDHITEGAAELPAGVSVFFEHHNRPGGRNAI
jgi:hypothetical protein